MTSKTGVPLLFEISSPGRRGYRLPELDVPEVPVDELIPTEYLRQQEAELPEVSELEACATYPALPAESWRRCGFLP